MYVYKRGKSNGLSHSTKSLSFYASSTSHCHHDMLMCTADGRKERVQFDKITARVSRLCYGLDPEHVDPAAITQKVISGVYQGVTTVELDNLVSRVFPFHPVI